MIVSVTFCFVDHVTVFVVARKKFMLLMTLFDVLTITSVSLGISFFSAHFHSSFHYLTVVSNTPSRLDFS